MTESRKVTTRWSIFATAVSSQLNFDMDREEFLGMLRILHDYEAHEIHLKENDSLIGPMYSVDDELWEFFADRWDLGWPGYPTREATSRSEREVDPSPDPSVDPTPDPSVEGQNVRVLRRPSTVDDAFLGNE